MPDTILFNPYWELLERVWKQNKLKKLDEISSIVAIKCREQVDYDFIKENQEMRMKSIQEVLDLWIEIYPKQATLLRSIKVKKSIPIAAKTFELTLKLYSNWSKIFNSFSNEAIKGLNLLNA